MSAQPTFQNSLNWLRDNQKALPEETQGILTSLQKLKISPNDSLSPLSWRGQKVIIGSNEFKWNPEGYFMSPMGRVLKFKSNDSLDVVFQKTLDSFTPPGSASLWISTAWAQETTLRDQATAALWSAYLHSARVVNTVTESLGAVSLNVYGVLAVGVRSVFIGDYDVRCDSRGQFKVFHNFEYKIWKEKFTAAQKRYETNSRLSSNPQNYSQTSNALFTAGADLLSSAFGDRVPPETLQKIFSKPIPTCDLEKSAIVRNWIQTQARELNPKLTPLIKTEMAPTESSKPKTSPSPGSSDRGTQ